MASTKADLNGYELSRDWFDWCFENPDLISTNHTALYFFIIEHCNRLGWKEKFGLPSSMAMEALGIKNWRTFKKAFEDITSWGFIKLIEKSKNQYSANIIAIVKNTKANTKARTKATQKHVQKQCKSIVGINKPNNLGTYKPNNLLPDEPAAYWKNFIKVWEDWYQENLNSKYEYLGKDFKSLKKIHSFFQKRAADKKIEFTEQYLLDAFNFFLKKAWEKDQWLRNNFSIPNVLSQFNQIQNQAKVNHGTNQAKPAGNTKGALKNFDGVDYSKF